MLEQLRAAARSWIAVVFLVVVGLAVAFTGGFGGFGGDLGGDVAKFGAERYSYTEFQRQWRQALQRQRVNTGDRSLTEAHAREAGLPRQLVFQLGLEARLRQEADDLKLAASNEMVVRAIAEIEGVRDAISGRLDTDVVRSILNTYQMTEEQLASVFRDQVIRDQVLSALQAGVAAPLALADHQRLFRFQERLVSAVFIPRDAAPAPPPPSDEAIAAYFEENAARFRSPEQRAVRLVVAAPDVEAAAETLEPELTESAVADALAARATPETRTIVELPAPSREIAAQVAERWRAGEAPEAIARALALSGVNRYDGARRDELFDDRLADAAFDLEVGAVSDPIETALSWSVVTVEAITPETRPDEAIVRLEVVEELAEARALAEAARKGRAFERALTDGLDLAAAAEAADLPVYEIAAVTRAGLDPDGEPVAPVAGFSAVLERAFTQPEGLTTPLVAAEDGRQFALRVLGVTPSEPLPLEAVREDIAAALAADAEAEAQRTLVEAVRAALAGGAALAEAAGLAGDAARTDMFAFARVAPPEALGAQALRLFEPELAPGEAIVLPGPNGAAIAARFETPIPVSQESAAFAGMLRQPLRQTIAQDFEAMYLAALEQRYPAQVNWESVDRAVGAAR